MDRYEFEINYKNEDFYWWFVGRRRIVFSFIKRFFKVNNNGAFLLDAGCGTGIVLKDLSSFGTSVGIDLSQQALGFSRTRGIHNLVAADLGQRLPFKDESFDLVTILGVLCTKYIPDEISVLKELYRITRKGGFIISDEGAFRILLSRHNERVGGSKRYRKGEMRRMVEESGFKVIRCSYWNMFLFPWFLAAKLLDTCIPSSHRGFANMELPLPRFMNVFFTELLTYELRMLQFLNLPFGTSIITVGIKP